MESSVDTMSGSTKDDLPLAKLPLNVVLMDCCAEQVPAELLTVTIPPFTTSEHPSFHEGDGQGSVRIQHVQI